MTPYEDFDIAEMCRRSIKKRVALCGASVRTEHSDIFNMITQERSARRNKSDRKRNRANRWRETTMNRQQALEWLVENVTKWPTDMDFREKCNEWGFWELFNGDIVFSQDDWWMDYPDESGSDAEIITQSDWLSAADNMKEKRDE